MALITWERRGAVMCIGINRPDKKNALTLEMYSSMGEVLDAVGDNEDIKAVLLYGEGDNFTAGNDIGVFADEEIQLAPILHFMQALIECPVPVVAQVHGQAVGIGTTMLLHCDFVYASEDAHLIMPFVKLGLVPEFGSSYLLPRMVGQRKAAKWLLMGDPIPPQEAMEGGIITEVFAPERLQQKVQQRLERLCSQPRDALIHSKELMHYDDEALRLHIDTEIDAFYEALQSTAAKEAFNAFLEKRQPDPDKYH